MYVGGNGGFLLWYVELFVLGLDDDGLICVIDCFFMYYIWIVDWLQCIVGWCVEFDGGFDGFWVVIFEDSFGVCDDLDVVMSWYVDCYEDEWVVMFCDFVKF